MDELPDLEQLSVAEKGALIRELWPLRGLVRDLATTMLTWGALATMPGSSQDSVPKNRFARMKQSTGAPKNCGHDRVSTRQ